MFNIRTSKQWTCTSKKRTHQLSFGPDSVRYVLIEVPLYYINHIKSILIIKYPVPFFRVDCHSLCRKLENTDYLAPPFCANKRL